MSGLSAGHVGIAGEVRFVVKRGDGSIKEDTGFQKNLILNQGLDFFGGNKGVDIFSRCVIGSGNESPIATQTQLSSFLAIVSGTQSSINYDYVPDSSNTYKTNKVVKYVFTGLNNANVSEVGLVSIGTTSADYYLCTRALIRDTAGLPTVVTILQGEVLEVYYKIWKVISTLDVNYVVNMLDGKGGITPYNVVVRPAYVGGSQNLVGVPSVSGGSMFISKKELAAITSASLDAIGTSSSPLSNYINGSYKVERKINFSTSEGNIGIRTVSAIEPSPLFMFQIRFGSVVGDNPIPKTNLQTLSIPIEYSWGRYEGVL